MYRLTDVTKDYPKGRGVVHALQGVNVVIADGDWLAIQGPTGPRQDHLLTVRNPAPRPGWLSHRGERPGLLVVLIASWRILRSPWRTVG